MDRLGADVLVEPFDTPGGGRVATVRDPAGAAVSLSQPGENIGAELHPRGPAGRRGHAPAPQEDPTPRWSIAFWVADADQAASRAAELGGRVLLPPMDIPVGRLTILADPQGAVFSATAVPGGPGRGVDGS
jgi:predicted enzyme related to lactoylglutathione lyase